MWGVLWRRVTPSTGWFPFTVLCLLDALAAYSTYRADWADGLGIVLRTMVLGVAVAYLLARLLAVPDWLAHPLGLAVGVGGVLWFLQRSLSDSLGGWQEKLAFLWDRWVRWYELVREGGRADDIYLFLALIGFAHFLIGYLSAWLLLRHDHAWISALLPTMVVLINAGYSRRVSVLFVSLVVLFDLWFVGRVAFARRLLQWRRLGWSYSSWLAWQSLWVLSWLSLAVLVIGWIVPFGTHSTRAAALLQPTSRTWNEVRDTLAQWFPSVRGPGGGRGVGGFASFGDQFDIGGPLRLSDEPVLVVAGTNAAYLTVRTYDTYTGRGWRSSAVPETAERSAEGNSLPTRTPEPASPVPLLEFSYDEPLPQDVDAQADRETVRYHFEVLQPRGASIPYTGNPVSFSIPVRALYGWTDPREWRMVDLRAVDPADMPSELRPLVELLRDASFVQSSGGSESSTPTPTDEPYADRPWYEPFMRGSPLLPRLDELVAQLSARAIDVQFWWEADGMGTFRVSRLLYRGAFPDFRDLEAIFPAEGTSRGLVYDLVTSVSRATPDTLRTAGQNHAENSDDVEVSVYGVYPRRLYERYTQLPETVTERTRQLAYALAAGKGNAYDVATAIESFVRERIVYNEAAPVPQGVDAVDSILFDRPEGYCTFYASAMAVLLRAVGIPARVAVGYYPGDFDSELGGFVYRDRNAHAWVEVYFPGYGWIPFEPTAARPPIPRGSIPGQSALLPLDPMLGANLPTDERFGLRLEELYRAEGAGGVGKVAEPQETGFDWVRALLLGLAVIVLLLGSAFAVWWNWGTWRLSPIGRLYVRFCRVARLARIEGRESTTPLEFAWEVGRRIPGTRRAAQMLVEAYMREQYGRRSLEPAELHQVRRAWQEILRPRLVRAALRFKRDREVGSDAWTSDRRR